MFSVRFPVRPGPLQVLAAAWGLALLSLHAAFLDFGNYSMLVKSDISLFLFCVMVLVSRQRNCGFLTMKFFS